VRGVDISIYQNNWHVDLPSAHGITVTGAYKGFRSAFTIMPVDILHALANVKAAEVAP